MKNMKPTKSIEDLSKKHNVPIGELETQLKMGIGVEHEHTKSKSLAKTIALHHIAELPNYYTRLKKIESVKEDWAVMDRQNRGDYIDGAEPDPMTGVPGPMKFKTKQEALQAAKQVAPGNKNVIPDVFSELKDKKPLPLDIKPEESKKLKEFFYNRQLARINESYGIRKKNKTK